MSTQADIEEKALYWFVALRDDDATDSAWLAFQAWLEASPTHAVAYDAVERLWVDMDQAKETPPRLEASAVVDLSSVRARRRTPWLAAGLGIAASVTFAVGLMFWMTPAEQSYSTTDAPLNVALKDGSHVLLNRHSELRVRFDGRTRAVSLAKGEAAFDIAHDPSHPFTVAAGDHQVQVLGTAFNILNYKDSFSLSVERGVVAVKEVAARESVRLIAGQTLKQEGELPAVLGAASPQQASAWRQGVLIYRDRPLTEIADDLSRYLDKPVVLSASARALRFTGALRIGDEAVMLGQFQDFAPVRIEASKREIRLNAREAG